jgi:hypothetical protein
MRSVRGVILLCVLSLVPAGARAQSDDDRRAAEHFRVGNEYLADNRFEDALREFREAFRLSGRVEMIFNEAVALEKLQRWGDAARAYERFVAQAGDHASRGDAVARAEEMRRRQAAQPPSPIPDPLPIGAAGESSSWTLPAIVVLGVSGLIGAAALVTGLIAHDTYTDLEAQCPGDVCAPDLEGDRDRGATLASVSTILSVTAGIGAVVGGVFVVLGLTESRSSEAGGSARVSPFAVPSGGGLELRGRF